MGKIESLIKFTGRVDNVVGAKGKNGEIIIRKYQNNPTKSQTSGQIIQRTRFLSATGIASLSGRRGLMGFTHYAIQMGMSIKNAFTKTNLLAVFNSGNNNEKVIKASLNPQTGDYESSIEWSELKFSKGSAGNIAAMTPRFDNPNEVDVFWGKRYADVDIPDTSVLTIIVLCPAMSEPAIVRSVNANVTGQHLAIETPASWSGQKVYVYGVEAMFGDEATAVQYLSVFNNNNVAAQAIVSELASQAAYSDTVYMGDGSIS